MKLFDYPKYIARFLENDQKVARVEQYKKNYWIVFGHVFNLIDWHYLAGFETKEEAIMFLDLLGVERKDMKVHSIRKQLRTYQKWLDRHQCV